MWGDRENEVETVDITQIRMFVPLTRRGHVD